MQNKKNEKSVLIESRLKLLSLALKYQDVDMVEILISKSLQIENLNKEVVDIIHNVELDLKFLHFEQSINQINEYLKQKPKVKRIKEIVISEDIEIKELRQELKSLEEVFQQLIEEKTEYLNNIEEFNIQYNLHLGDLIKTILDLRKEILYKKTIKNQNLKKKFKEDKNTYSDTEQTIEELKNTIVELEEILENINKNDENYDEIKNAYDEIKKELEKLEEELLVQEKELQKTEEQLKENETFEEEYEEVKSTYEEFNNQYEYIKDTQKDIIKLSDEEKIELKKLWKKACKLCHPDIVTDELKEKAHEIMQSLNDAYSKKDILKVKEILSNLENGITFKTISCDIEDKELLQNKIKEFKENISILENEIQNIKQDDTFVTISELEDWDEYFEELKNELVKEKEQLEKEANDILEEKSEVEDIPEWMQRLWNWADENNISSSKLSRKIENLINTSTIDFTNLKLKNIPSEIINLKKLTTLVLWDCDLKYLPKDIIKLNGLKKLNIRGNSNLSLTQSQKDWIDELMKKATVFSDRNFIIISDSTLDFVENSKFNNINQTQNEVKKTIIVESETSQYSKYIQSIENPNFEKIRRYCNNLLNDNQADNMQKYLANNGKMYKAIIYDALEQFMEKLDGETITLVDWGCNQGIGSMLVLDYIKEKQLDTTVNQIILVDDNTTAISRAMTQIESLKQNDIKVITIQSDDIDEIEKLKDINNKILNLTVNDKFPIDYLDIDYELFKDAYFMCVSNTNKAFVNDVYENISDFSSVENLSIRDTKIGRFEKFERIFKI